MKKAIIILSILFSACESGDVVKEDGKMFTTDEVVKEFVADEGRNLLSLSTINATNVISKGRLGLKFINYDTGEEDIIHFDYVRCYEWGPDTEYYNENEISPVRSIIGIDTNSPLNYEVSITIDTNDIYQIIGGRWTKIPEVRGFLRYNTSCYFMTWYGDEDNIEIKGNSIEFIFKETLGNCGTNDSVHISASGLCS